MGTCWQEALQRLADPTSSSTVQASPSSSHRAGQEDGGSQVSWSSTIPFPQLGAQSRSLAAVHPCGQQRSPEPQVVMGTWVQTRSQFAGVPRAKSAVQGSVSVHEAGQAPG